MKELLGNYRKEYEQIQTAESEDAMERRGYLKAILQLMNKREKFMRDIDETRKLSQGKGTTLMHDNWQND